MRAAPPPMKPPASAGTGRIEARARRFALACFAPSLVLVVGLIFYPFLYTVVLSFQRRQLFEKAGSFIGVENYARLFASAEFWTSLVNGLVFSGGSLLLQVVLGVALAVLLNRSFIGRGFFRGLLLFPYLIPSVVGIFAIRWMLNDLYGIVNYWLLALGVVKQALPWFGQPQLAMASLIGINTWMFYPFVMLCVLARLQSIPPDLYEAARMDGAGEWAQFWHVTLPQLRGTLAVVVIVRTMWMFNKFDTVWLTTQGGPFGSTQTLPVLAYVEAFSLYEIGRASAIGILMSAILLAVFVLYQRLFLRIQRWQ
ncbi:MAG: sugar ABC transporter permease [Vicinamibacterales bacterium]